jgi:hypothetical protein
LQEQLQRGLYIIWWVKLTGAGFEGSLLFQFRSSQYILSIFRPAYQ